MKKKLLSLVAASAMALTIAVPSYAEPANLKDLMGVALGAGAFATTVEADGYAYNATTQHFNVEVGAEVQVKKSSEGTAKYADYDDPSSPLTVKASSVTSKDANFDFKAIVDMSNVRKAFKAYYDKAKVAATATSLSDQFDSMKIAGQFKITVNTDGLTVPTSFINGNNLAGFSANTIASGIYSEVSRIKMGADTYVITIKAEGDADEIYADIDNKLCDLELECDGVTVTKFGKVSAADGYIGIACEFDASIDGDAYKDGYTDIVYMQGADEVTLATIDYKSDDDAAYVLVNKTTSSGGGSGSSGGGTSLPVAPSNSLNFVTPQGSIQSQTSTNTFTVKGDSLPTPTSDDDDMVFEGWYLDSSYTQPVDPDTEITVSGSVNVFAKWLNTKVPDALNNESEAGTHYAYIIGYPEGDVRPTNNITRAEVITIFYRLLNDDKRAQIKSTTNSFSDVSESDWFNTYVSTMENGGYIKGYYDGTFKPDEYITRAEFATIAVAFADKTVAPTATFSDISGHWAAENILKGAALSWIQGYEDGTFRPDEYITRAEAMTMYNRVLVRHVKGDGFLPASAILWPDNAESAWYYYDVEEATNSHTYDRQADKYYESWTAVIPNKTWD